VVDSGLPVFNQSDAAIKMLEEEKRRIARELHDGPAQDLTNISMRLDIISRLLDSDIERAKAELNRTNSRIVSAINEIRRLIYDLRPVAIDEVGLVSATRDMLKRFTSEANLGFEMDADASVADQFPAARQVAMFRLIQEIANNIRKHAEATMVTVRFTNNTTHLTITVKDNGKGFNPDFIPDGHYGIIGMKERAAFLGGCLEIDSELGKGSLFTISVPIAATDA
jgi:two-component system sensor histidine kinase DegS